MYGEEENRKGIILEIYCNDVFCLTGNGAMRNVHEAQAKLATL